MNRFITILLELSAYLNTRFSKRQLENRLIAMARFLRKKSCTEPTEQIVVFGASFNPTTLGHVDFIRSLLRNFAKIKVIPTGQSVLKTAEEYASVTDRLQILDLVIKTQFTVEEQARIQIETLEATRHSPSWMVMTLSALIIQRRGQESYILACGYDHLYLFVKWYRWKDLGDLCTLHFYPRAGVDILNPEAVAACMVLCAAQISMTVIFTELAQKEQFYALCLEKGLNLSMHKGLSLICDPNFLIRNTAASRIRAFYHTQRSREEVPDGLSQEAHHYIVEHHCYQHFL